ncbi:MAG: alternative ribosome rescue aminoacyl-tRNA hydrolase ArfB [Pseudomonadota bacterium]
MSLKVNQNITIPESELEEEFIRGSGPGGQNVNKVSSCVQLRFNIQQTSAIPNHIKERLKILAAGQINGEGFLMILAREFRSREQNREAARERLVKLIRQAAIIPKKRHKTKPTKSSKEKRLSGKQKHGAKKQWRGKVSW